MNEQELRELLQLRALDTLTDEQTTRLAELEQKLRALPDAAAASGAQNGSAEGSAEGSGSEPDERSIEQIIASAVEKSMATVRAELGKNKSKNGQELNPDADPSTIRVGDDVVAPWDRRAGKYFYALARTIASPEEGQGIVRSIMSDMDLASREIKGEIARANQILERSGLSASKQLMLRHAIDLPTETRIATTSTTDAVKAGFLLPKPFLAELFVIIEQRGVVRRTFRNIPMTSKDLDLKNVLGKVEAFWTNEAVNFTESNAEFGEQKLLVNGLAGITSWSSEQEEDQVIMLLPMLQDLFAESINDKEDRAGLLGDGTATYGGNTGVLNLPGAAVHTMTSISGTDLAEAHLRAAKNSLSLARRTGARWYMHPDTKDHIAQLENTAGFRIFQPSLQQGTAGNLLGFPVEETEVLPSPTGVGADEGFIAFGNPNRALFGQRRGVSADISREAVLQDAQGDIKHNAFQADLALLRIKQRVGVKIPQAFESAWAIIRTAENT